MSESAASGSWTVAGTSVPGASHRKSGLPCQDAHSWTVINDSILITAVCDGAGSARLSHLGAQTAANKAVETVRKCILEKCPVSEEDWRNHLEQARAEALSRINELANSEGCSVCDLATTFLLAAAAPDCTAALQIGDGAIVARLDDGELDLLSQPESGEYANETTFLTSPGAQAQLRIGSSCESLALFSDGIQRLALRFPALEPHDPFFKPLFDFLDGAEDIDTLNNALNDFLTSPRVCTFTDDDITLIVARRRNP